MLQIGVDQQPALVLVDVLPGMSAVMGLFDGCHHLRDIVSFASSLGISTSSLEWALRTLDGAGLLTEGARAAPRHASLLTTQRVRLLGAGTLGGAIGELLYHSGLGLLHVVDNAAPASTRRTRGAAFSSRAEAFRSSLGEGAEARVRVANHWSKPEGVRPDLTIIATDEMECDRLVTAHLMRTDEPHLLVRARAGGVVVGPLVQPGRSACVRCTDLTRRDADAAWPTLLPQLQRTRVPITAALAAWAGGVGAAQALAFLQGGTPETCDSTLEISPDDYETRRRTWAMHPGCGCGWDTTAQWEP